MEISQAKTRGARIRYELELAGWIGDEEDIEDRPDGSVLVGTIQIVEKQVDRATAAPDIIEALDRARSDSWWYAYGSNRRVIYTGPSLRQLAADVFEAVR